MTTPEPMRRRAIAALVLVNLLWGISFPVMKAANMMMARRQSAGSGPGQGSSGHDAMNWPGQEIPDTSSALARATSQATAACFLIVVRFSIALLLLGVFVPRLFIGLEPAHWRMGAWVGLAFTAGFVLQIVGLNYIPASRSGFLTSLSVIFTPLVMFLIERRPPRWTVVAGGLVALVGTGILTGLFALAGPAGIRLADHALDQIGPGDWLTMLAAGIFTAQILLIDFFGRRMPAGQLTPGMFVATMGLGIALFSTGHFLQPPAAGMAVWAELVVDGRFLLLILTMSIFCTVLAFHWMNKYQPHVSAAQAAMIYTLEPVFATLWAMFLPDILSRTMQLDYRSERPGLELAAGGLLVVVGNALALWPDRGRT